MIQQREIRRLASHQGIGFRSRDWGEAPNVLLVISGERKEEYEEDGKTWHRLERSTGSFRRVIPLEATADADKIDATYRDGVLRIVVPKAEEAKPRRINVHV